VPIAGAHAGGHWADWPKHRRNPHPAHHGRRRVTPGCGARRWSGVCLAAVWRPLTGPTRPP